MPSTKQIQTTLSALPTTTDSFVVVLVGATTGIGSYIARALARTFSAHGSKLRVYLVGRNATRASEILEYGRTTSPGSDWRFLEVKDLALMSEVDAVVGRIEEVEAKEPFGGEGKGRVDAVWLGQALSPMQESPVTKEGLDSQMSLLYYSRIRFIQKLTPLLTASSHTAHVISIFAGDMEDKIAKDFLPIGTPPRETYGPTAVRTHVTFMKTFMFEELAERHAGKISFTHVFPGLVDGPAFYSNVNPWWFRVSYRVVKALLGWWYMTPPEVCGDVMVSLASERYPAKGTLREGDVEGGVANSSQNERGGGAYRVGSRGDDNGKVSYKNIRREDTGKRVWEHTMNVFAEIDSKNVPT